MGSLQNSRRRVERFPVEYAEACKPHCRLQQTSQSYGAAAGLVAETLLRRSAEADSPSLHSSTTICWYRHSGLQNARSPLYMKMSFPSPSRHLQKKQALRKSFSGRSSLQIVDGDVEKMDSRLEVLISELDPLQPVGDGRW